MPFSNIKELKKYQIYFKRYIHHIFYIYYTATVFAEKYQQTCRINYPSLVFPHGNLEQLVRFLRSYHKH